MFIQCTSYHIIDETTRMTFNFMEATKHNRQAIVLDGNLQIVGSIGKHTNEDN